MQPAATAAVPVVVGVEQEAPVPMETTEEVVPGQLSLVEVQNHGSRAEAGPSSAVPSSAIVSAPAPAPDALQVATEVARQAVFGLSPPASPVEERVPVEVEVVKDPYASVEEEELGEFLVRRKRKAPEAASAPVEVPTTTGTSAPVGTPALPLLPASAEAPTFVEVIDLDTITEIAEITPATDQTPLLTTEDVPVERRVRQRVDSPVREDGMSNWAFSVGAEKIAMFDAMVDTLVERGMVCSLEEKESLLKEKVTFLKERASFQEERASFQKERESFLSQISSLESQLSAEKKKFEVLNSSLGSEVGKWRQRVERTQRKLLRVQIDNDFYSLYLQDHEARVLKLLKEKDDKFAEQMKRRDSQIADLNGRLQSCLSHIKEFEAISQTVKEELEASKKREEELQGRCSKVPVLESQVQEQEKELASMKASLAALSASRAKEKNTLRAFYLHRFRLASFHAFTNFEWAPVKALLETKLPPHEKEEKILEEETSTSGDEA